MDFSPIRPDVVKYEMRLASGENPFVQEQKTPGGFGRFLSGVGRFFAAVATPMSLIFPPAAIGAAGMYGVGQIGDQIQQRSYMNMMKQTPQYISYPGLDTPPPQGGIQMMSSGTTGLSAQQETVMDVLFARNDMMLESVQKF